MAWQIKLTDTAKKQLAKMGHVEARRITDYLRKRIEPADDPREFGKALTGRLAELWRYRVGDYRIICQIEEERLIVLVLRVGHRKEVYRSMP